MRMFRSFIAVMTLLFASVSVAQEHDFANGERPFIRIQIGSETNQDTRELTRRVYLLEQAVRVLQDRLYDLEDGDKEIGNRYTCSYEVCRKSSSVHAKSQLHCIHSNLWENEEKIVWAFSGAQAKEKVKEALKTDRDVVGHMPIFCYL